MLSFLRISQHNRCQKRLNGMKRCAKRHKPDMEPLLIFHLVRPEDRFLPCNSALGESDDVSSKPFVRCQHKQF